WLCLCLPAPAAAATRAELPSGAVVLEDESLGRAAAEGDALAQGWIALVERGEFAVVGRAAAVRGEDAGAAARQLALSRLVRHLQDTQAGRGKAGRALLASLAGREPLAWRRHEETRGDWFVPVVDPGAE